MVCLERVPVPSRTGRGVHAQAWLRRARARPACSQRGSTGRLRAPLTRQRRAGRPSLSSPFYKWGQRGATLQAPLAVSARARARGLGAVGSLCKGAARGAAGGGRPHRRQVRGRGHAAERRGAQAGRHHQLPRRRPGHRAAARHAAARRPGGARVRDHHGRHRCAPASGRVSLRVEGGGCAAGGRGALAGARAAHS